MFYLIISLHRNIQQSKTKLFRIDDEKRVIYQFGPNENQMGEIEFDKEKKSFSVLKHVNDSKISNQAYENWASEQIIKIMFRNNGQFPDITSVEK